MSEFTRLIFESSIRTSQRPTPVCSIEFLSIIPRKKVSYGWSLSTEIDLLFLRVPSCPGISLCNSTNFLSTLFESANRFPCLFCFRVLLISGMEENGMSPSRSCCAVLILRLKCFVAFTLLRVFEYLSQYFLKSFINPELRFALNKEYWVFSPMKFSVIKDSPLLSLWGCGAFASI